MQEYSRDQAPTGEQEDAEMTPANQCKVFLSYSSADRVFVDGLAQELKTLGFTVYYDVWKIVGGDSLTDSITKGIECADMFAIVLSPNSVSGNWPKEELRAALARRIANPRFKIVPILRKPCRIPLLLQDYHRIPAPPKRPYRVIADDLVKVARKLGFVVPALAALIPETQEFLGGGWAPEISMTMTFGGRKGEVTLVTERFRVITKKRQFDDIREIRCSGTVDQLMVLPGTLAVNETQPGVTAIKLSFNNKKWRTEPFDFAFSYVLRNAFDVEEFWDYMFQMPVHTFNATLEFEAGVRFCKCFRYQGGIETTPYRLNQR